MSKNTIVFKGIFNVNQFYYVKFDLKNLTYWLNDLNWLNFTECKKKIELVIFKHQGKKVHN